MIVKVGIVIGFICCFGIFQSLFAKEIQENGLYESFEENIPPDNWKLLDGGNVELSLKHYKHGFQSLRWMWNKGSRLRIIEPVLLERVGRSKHGGMKLWIYNEDPIDDVLTFKLGTQQQLDKGNPHYKFQFGLNFQGWRVLWVKFNQEGYNKEYIGNPEEPLQVMEINSPNIKGSVYFDLLEFEEKMPKSRSADYQMTKEGVPDIEEAMYWDKAYYYSQMKPSIAMEEIITQKQVDDFKKISEKYEKWIYGENLDLNKQPLYIRNKALQQFIQEGLQAYEKLDITRHSDGRITGVPLFSSRDPHLPKLGEDVSKKVLLPLVYDYKINGNIKSKEKFFNTLDHMYDQGWAEGSGLGTMDHESNKHNGYFHAVYLMRDELKETGRLDREFRTFGWQTLFNKTFETEFFDVTADELRTKFMYNLLYVLLMDDTPKKVCYMKGLVNYYNQALKIAPGYSGTIKPDYTLYHHRGPYLSAYGPNGIHMAALIAYLTSGTSFELSEESMGNIKESLLHARIYANKYNVPLSASGRLPDISGTLINSIPAYAYMALATNPIDTQMASAFMRLWEPNYAYLKDKLFSQAHSYKVDYVQTMGGLQLAMDLAEKGYEAEKSPVGTWVYPYSSLAIHRQNNWMVAVKGHSQYVWDFEGTNKFNPQTLKTLKENVFGRYQSYGSMQINGTGLPEGTIESGYDLNNGWDWNRWPGTTTINLPLSELATPGGNKNHRLFTDQVFVGGVTNQNKYGIFAMKFHDTHHDTSFKATKSFFFFEDKIICLGSNIKNEDITHSTETTLFQSYMTESTMPFWFNSKKEKSNQTYMKVINNEQPIWIIDPYYNGYYIPNAKGLNVKRGIQRSRDHKDIKHTEGYYTTAWIDHGKNPTNSDYEYVVKVKTNPEEMKKFVKNLKYEVLQKDEQAHIVKNIDPFSTIMGYVIMDNIQEIKHGYIQQVSKPCMIMTCVKNENEIVLSMSDPDLRLPKFDKHVDINNESVHVESIEETLNIKLRGRWNLKTSSEGIRIISSDDQSTTIELDCIDGQTNEVVLVAQKI